ncbi:MAG: PLP-dependent aminotransferase family protein [Clostridia bacterium]|nr:PLP-dependent aminotransferase family protein [Clostridia bacterium]
MQRIADRFAGITGSEIRKIFSLLADPEIISLAGGNPAPETFPSAAIAEIAEQVLRERGERILQYGATPGISSLLELLSRENADIMRPGDGVITLTGSSQGIDFFARTVLNEGDPVVVESPTFLGALQTLRFARADIRGVPLEEDGPDIGALEAVLREHHPKFFYTIPTFQNPTGITASADKRRAVYDLCLKYETLILEDDPYGQLRFEGSHIPSLKSMDEAGIVCRLASFSKTISPGLRVGYAVAPKDIIQCFNLLKQGADVHTANLTQAIVCEYIERGFYKPHIDEICGLYRAHRDRMLSALDRHMPAGCTYTRPDGGLFIWVELPESLDAGELFVKCVENKVAFVPGTSFFADGGHTNTLRLNFSMPDEKQIDTGIERLCGVIAAALAGR